MTPRDLPTKWRIDADTLSRYDEQKAAIVRMLADELETALRDEGDDMLSLADAAHESGYSSDRLRHIIAANPSLNAGRKGAPLIRRRDLPRKSRGGGNAFDAERIADDITRRRRA